MRYCNYIKFHFIVTVLFIQISFNDEQQNLYESNNTGWTVTIAFWFRLLSYTIHLLLFMQFTHSHSASSVFLHATCL
jgi:hypothetical protein